MKKRNLLLSILLSLIILFPTNAFAAESIQDGAEMEDGFARIGGGIFQMGSPAGEPERSSDETQHSVTIGDFYMAKTEVSQKDYQAMMGINPSVTKGDNLPVTNITWYDAIQYCNRLSVAEGLTPCYSVSGTTVTWNKAANGYRLPTEAEWEYAARAATTTPFHFGDYVHNSDANCYNAYGYNNDASGNWVNGSEAYLRRTVEVDQYPANAYGLYNMHGNAAEWVWDWYGEYSSGAAANPSGPENGNVKIIRGGGWNDHPKHIRSAYRGAQPADVGLYSIGVRPVRNAVAATGETKSIYSAKAEQKTGKTLIVYFSQTGNTEGLANLIHEMSGAEIFRLERKIPYSSSSNGPVLYGEALNELRAEAVPELKSYPDIDRYDTILLGYCNWWSSIPASVRSFLLHDDFSGKTIVPFCSMGGGHFGQTISAIAKLASDSVIKEGLEVTYSSYNRDEISAWLEKSLPDQSNINPDSTPAPTPEQGECSHSYENRVSVEPACMAAGEMAYTCIHCGESYKEKIPAAGHKFQETAVKAGMAKEGSFTEICTICKYIGNEKTVAAVNSIRLSGTSYSYNGKKQKPSVTVMDRQQKRLKEGTDYTLDYPVNPKNVGIYTVTIRFRGNYEGTEKRTFQISPKKTAIVRLSAGKKSFAIKWKKQKNQVDGYEIAYSVSSKFQKKKTKTITVGKGASSKKISKLKAGKKYYVRLRAYKTVKSRGGQKKLYAGWSKVKTVKVKK